ncbi:MAG TPA: hypothetical protein VD838_09460, partial [Anaeromyxobacteraceae bacterium]|nr:hypothetical protein [Anaeromyxobacteraceae bacterium]
MELAVEDPLRLAFDQVEALALLARRRESTRPDGREHAGRNVQLVEERELGREAEPLAQVHVALGIAPGRPERRYELPALLAKIDGRPAHER